MIPIIYESTETLFSNNGMGRLRDCISCRVTEGRNEVYECDFEYPVNGANFDKIQCGRIIGVIHDDTKTIQPFDIVSYSKPINGIVTFHAVHISYRLTGLTVSGTNINSLADALALLGTATPSSAFTYSADFTSSAYMAAADGTPRSVRQMLGGIEGSILDTYGGEYEFDKFNVILHRNRGTRKDVRIRYGVNMLDYNEDLDFSEAFTSCIPYWVGDDGNGEQTVITGQKVSSGLMPYDGRERCVPLDLSSRFETAPTAADLEQKALNLMTSGNVNLPKQSIKVDFVRLQDFGEYEGFANLLTCGLCDLIEVIFPDYDTSGSFKIVKTIYDVLSERYESMELGALSTTLAQALGITESLEAVKSGGGGAIRYGVCSASGSTVAKTVNVTPALEELQTGAVILVKFDNANTASSPTLNVNGTGAKAIKRYGTTAPSTSAASSWNAGSVCWLIYDGSYWQMAGWINTTYSSMTVAEYEAGTGTTARIITPARLKDAIQYWASGAGPYTSLPAMDGTASAGSSSLYSRGDHVHPTDTSRQEALVSGTNIKTVNGNSLLGSGDLVLPTGQSSFHGTCATDAATANKVVTSTPAFIDTTGSLIAVTFTYANTVEGLISLKVDSDSYRPVYVNNTATSATNTLLWEAGETVLFQCVLRGPQNVYEYIAKSNGNIDIASSTTYGVIKLAQYYDPPGGYVLITYANGDTANLPVIDKTNDGLTTIRAKFLPDASTSTKGAVIVDNAMDANSTNAVQNSVIKAYVDNSNVLEGVQKNGTDLPINNKKVNIPLMMGASASASGASGLVPMPSQGQQSYLLFGDGYWENLYVSAYAGPANYFFDIQRYNTGTSLALLTLPAATTTDAGAMAAADKTKLDGIATGAEANVQSNWSETDSSSDAFILNKPTIPTTASEVGAIASSRGNITGAFVYGSNNVKLGLQGTNKTDNCLYLFGARNNAPYLYNETNDTVVWTGYTTANPELPTVTSSDDGKVLRVVNGAWSAVALPSASGVNF